MLLGRSGELISPNDIIRRIGIVDIEHYRKLIASLQKKFVLINTKTKGQVQSIQKREKIGARDVARFKIIPFIDIDTKGFKNKPEPRSPKHKAVSQDRSPTKLAQSRELFVDRTLYVVNTPPITTERDVMEAFSQFGAIASVRIPGTGGVSKGYVFIEFEDPNDAAKAIGTSPEIGGRSLRVRWATPQTRRR